jgi:hypothetical protein
MDDSIIYGLAHRQLRRLTIYVIRLVFLLLYIKPCVWWLCASRYAETGYNT